MKKKLTAILLSCAILASQTVILPAFAEERDFRATISSENSEYDEENITVDLAASGTYYEDLGLYFDKSTGTITDCDESKAGDFVIPSEIDGVKVTSIGDWAFYYCTSLTSVTIPNSVTEIGYSAFERCTGLTSVTIPNSVTEIGYNAFEYCKSLTTVTIPNSVTEIREGAFEYCTSLTSITIPDSVTSIGDFAFLGCDSLTSINVDEENQNYSSVDGNLFNKAKTELIQYAIGKTDKEYNIPNSVTSIGDYAFAFCESLISVSIPNSVTEIGEYTFNWCTSLISVSIPNSVTEIGEYTFNWCTSLTSVELPNGVTSIGKGAFWYCTSLTSVTIPNSLTSIGNCAFYYCKSLKNVTIPSSVTNIEDSAFSFCYSLRSIIISSSVTEIGYGAFAYCESLTNVYYTGTESEWNKIIINSDNESLTNATIHYNCNPDEIPTEAPEINDVIKCLEFDKYTGTIMGYTANIEGEVEIPSEIDGVTVTSIGGYAFNYCDSLTSVTIPNTVTEIGTSAFEGCTSLTSVSIPNSVKEIGEYAFCDCAGLTEITIPDSVTSIGNGAFSECLSLTKATISKNITRLGDSMFGGCLSLTSITIPSSVTSIGEYAFGDCKSLTSITIPDSVTSIGEFAFQLCTSLLSVTIPNSITTIGRSVFYDCISLISVTISKSITSIGETAFYNCKCLSDVYYTGTENEWNDIGIESLNESLTSATIHYNCNPSEIPTITPTEKPEITDDAKCLKFNKYTGTITGYTTNIEGEVEIPAEIDGVKVVKIGDYAFVNCDEITKVTIPDTVTTIGEGAFECSYSLSQVVISNSVTSIGVGAFRGCLNLTDIKIPESVASIGDMAFYNCNSLTSIMVDENNPNYSSLDGNLYNKDKTRLIQYAIGKIDEEFIIPDSVKYVNDDAVCSCNNENLIRIKIPSSVMEIGYNAFGDNIALESINVDEENPSYSSVDGNLFNKDKTELIQYAIGKTNEEYTVPNGVTTICDDAFFCCENLKQITIPKTVTEIEWAAFGYCINLTSIVIPEGIKCISGDTFYGCESLNEITIPNGVTTIEEYAFGNCTSLTSITIPKTVTSIEGYAFEDCDSLTDVYYTGSESEWNKISIGIFNELLKNATIHYALTDTPTVAPTENENVKYLTFSPESGAITDCDERISGELIIPSEIDGVMVRSIKGKAFYDCKNLTSVTIPNTVRKIEYDTFYGCESLESITIPSSVTSIGDNAFYNCYSLASITIPNGVTSIGGNVFYNCYSLASISIPKSVTRIGSTVFGDEFKNCKSLTSIDVDEENQKYSSVNGVLFNKDKTKLIKYPVAKTDKGYTVPNNVTEIGGYAFKGCESLTSVTIPSSVTRIGGYAFDDCNSLTDTYYTSTEEQWKAITIYDGNYILRENIHYNSKPTEPTESIDSINGSHEVIGDYAEKVQVECTADEDNVTFTITPKTENVTEFENLKLFVAGFDENSSELGELVIGESEIKDGVITLEAEVPDTMGSKIYIWDENLAPLMMPIIVKNK